MYKYIFISVKHVHIIIFVEDETTAKRIIRAINQIDCMGGDDSSSSNLNCKGIMKYLKSARVVEVTKSSSATSEDKLELYVIILIVLMSVIAVAIIVAIIVFSIACTRMKKNAKNSSDNCDVIMTDGGVFIVDDNTGMTPVAMTQMFSSSQPVTEGTPSSSIESGSDMTMLQTFQ